MTTPETTTRTKLLRWVPWAATALVGVYLLIAVIPFGGGRAESKGYDMARFAQLPVSYGGRFKPMDTVARNVLTIINGKQSFEVDGEDFGPRRWLLDVLAKPHRADTYPVFRIDHPDVRTLIGQSEASDRQRFSFQSLAPHQAQVTEQARQAQQVEEARRSSFQKQVIELHNHIQLYQRIRGHVAIHTIPEARSLGNTAQTASIETVSRSGPPMTTSGSDEGWVSLAAVMAHARNHEDSNRSNLPEIARSYIGVFSNYNDNNPAMFNQQTASLAATLGVRFPSLSRQAWIETQFNRIAPFYRTMLIYVIAALAVIGSWLIWPKALQSTAAKLVGLALVVHTLALGVRIYLSGRPPVTNLYSSAIFVGWGVVVLSLVLEWINDRVGQRAAVWANPAQGATALAGAGSNRPVSGGEPPGPSDHLVPGAGLGLLTAAVVGALTLLIARGLSSDGDTMAVLQAVLDTNFWLATHVVVITLGYSATFVAGFLGIVYILRGIFTTTLGKIEARRLAQMIYGIICFATLFAFVGTILGGIWADQSWGRFWGWDPKENGAMMIVLWNAIILHARWGGVVRGRGLALLAIFGNIVTAWSWFGVNMLGTGLHSYGFIDSQLTWLLAFVASQIILIALGTLPLDNWRSRMTA